MCVTLSFHSFHILIFLIPPSFPCDFSAISLRISYFSSLNFFISFLLAFRKFSCSFLFKMMLLSLQTKNFGAKLIERGEKMIRPFSGGSLYFLHLIISSFLRRVFARLDEWYDFSNCKMGHFPYYVSLRSSYFQ